MLSPLAFAFRMARSIYLHFSGPFEGWYGDTEAEYPKGLWCDFRNTERRKYIFGNTRVVLQVFASHSLG